MTFVEYYYYYYYHRYSCQHPCGILPTKSIENNGCVPYHLQFLIWALYTISWKACVSCITSLSELHIYPWAHTLPHPHFLKPPIPLPSNIHPFYLLPLHPIYDIIICFPFRPTTPFLLLPSFLLFPSLFFLHCSSLIPLVKAPSIGMESILNSSVERYRGNSGNQYRAQDEDYLLFPEAGKAKKGRQLSSTFDQGFSSPPPAPRIRNEGPHFSHSKNAFLGSRGFSGRSLRFYFILFLIIIAKTRLLSLLKAAGKKAVHVKVRV